ncbi:hypothetical protein [Alkalihalophilus marmarensis]|uniref:hypothetical protein n=1 Tax=Alkalihalophilus marmarensis TaxID=521377 RepID=UPI002E1B83D1|nr:hypothetical protein [Alkalihalophilus marmarensis]
MALLHGQSGTRLHSIWRKMKHRCNNQNDNRYTSYGGRGIKVCSEWETAFIHFHDWAYKNGYEDHLTIERIDVNGDYTPSNCKWITEKEQHRNKQNTLYVLHDGKKRPLIEWAETLDIPYKTLTSRWYRGSRGADLFKPTRKRTS